MSTPMKMTRIADEQHAIIRAYTMEQREEDRSRIRKTGAARMAAVHAVAKAEWDAKVAAVMEEEKLLAEKVKSESHCIEIPSNDSQRIALSAPHAYHFQSKPTDPW
jgi:uncharacterized membrane protein